MQQSSSHGNAKSSTCSQCLRLNRADARYCDWCGAKPQKAAATIISCCRCGQSNSPYTKFCVACGTLIQASGFDQANSSNWLSTIDSKAAHILNKHYSTVSTQTYGLFYTSAKSLSESSNKSEKLMLDKEFQERRPALTAVSAGKGYWRQQLDHICAHLKAYSQNNSEFRAVVGEPRLGKVLKKENISND